MAEVSINVTDWLGRDVKVRVPVESRPSKVADYWTTNHAAVLDALEEAVRRVKAAYDA